jgi:hypothetical protein
MKKTSLFRWKHKTWCFILQSTKGQITKQKQYFVLVMTWTTLVDFNDPYLVRTPGTSSFRYDLRRRLKNDSSEDTVAFLASVATKKFLLIVTCDKYHTFSLMRSYCGKNAGRESN